MDAIGAIYSESGDAGMLPYFEKNVSNVDGYDALSFMSNYMNLAKTTEGSNLDNALLKFKDVGTDMTQSPWRRLAATKSIFDLSQEYVMQMQSAKETNIKTRLAQKIEYLTMLLKDISNKEENDQLKAMYRQMQGV